MFEELFIARRGMDILEILKENNSNHFLAKEYKRSKGTGPIAAHYKEEYEKMLVTRSKGITGWIAFKGWI